MHRAALAAGPGEHLLERAEHPRALVAGDKPHAGEAAPPELGEELARSVHFGHGGHEGSVDVLVELELVRGEKLPMRSLECAAYACPRMRRGFVRSGRCGCSPRPRTVGLVSLGVHHVVNDLLGEAPESSCISMAPPSKRDMASMSGVGSDKISVAVFVLSQNLLLWLFRILWRRPFFVKRTLGRHP